VIHGAAVVAAAAAAAEAVAAAAAAAAEAVTPLHTTQLLLCLTRSLSLSIYGGVMPRSVCARSKVGSFSGRYRLIGMASQSVEKPHSGCCIDVTVMCVGALTTSFVRSAR
jgi:hypothetical protein